MEINCSVIVQTFYEETLSAPVKLRKSCQKKETLMFGGNFEHLEKSGKFCAMGFEKVKRVG